MYKEAGQGVDAETALLSPAAPPAAAGNTVDGYPACPAPGAWSAPENKPGAPMSCLQICLLALQVFTLLTSMVSFIIAATVNYRLKSQNFAIAAMVILCARTGVSLVLAVFPCCLQIIGLRIKLKLELVRGTATVPLGKVLCAVPPVLMAYGTNLDLMVILLAFGSSTASAAGIEERCSYEHYYDRCSPKAKAAVAMAFLASISELVTISLKRISFQPLSLAPTKSSEDKLKSDRV